MPLKAPSTPPGKKSKNQYALKGHQQRKPKSRMSLSSPVRNYDDELRQYLASTSKEVPAIGTASADLMTSSLKMPFSKDFGSFDLTICEADDNKCVVLVKYERRIFINGTQVYIRQDGRICDSHGSYNPVLQKYYDQASKLRRQSRKTSSTSLTFDSTNERKQSSPSRNAINENRQRINYVDAVDGDQASESDGDPGGYQDQDHNCTTDQEPDCQWGVAMTITKKSRVSIEAELHDLEKEFNKLIHALCTVILEVSNHETTDTESAHSEGDSLCPDQRQLVQEVIRRFSYQFQSVLELSNNLRDDETGLDDEGDGDDESSVVSDCFIGSPSSVVDNYPRERVNVQEIYRSSGGTPAWIHDGKSWRNEKARLHAELAAARSEQRRMERRQEELQVQFEKMEADRKELHEVLAEYQEENSKLKQRCAQVESLRYKSVDHEIDQHQRRDHGRKMKDTLQSAASAAGNATRGKSQTSEEFTGPPKHRSCHQDGKFLKTEMKRLRHVADDMEDDMERILQENVSLRVRVNQIERDRKDLKEKLCIAEAFCAETKSDLACLDKKNAELETRCQNLEREKASNEMEISRTSNLLVDLRSRYRALERDSGELDKTVKMLKTEKQHKREELDKLEREQIECNNKAGKLLKDNAELQVNLSQLKRDKASLEAEINMVRDEHEANCAVRKKAEEAREVAFCELRELRRAHAEMSEQISRLQETVASAESCCNNLKQQNEDLVSRAQELEDQNETLESQTRSLSNTGRLLEVENTELKHMMRRLRIDNADAKSRLATLSKSNADFQAKVEQWNRENASVEGKMRNLVSAKGDLENTIRQMMTLGTDAKNQFKRMDSEYEGLQKQQQRSKTQLVDGVDCSVYDVGGLANSLKLDLQDLDNADDNVGSSGRGFMISPPVPH